MTVPKAPDPARSRFAVLTLLRLVAMLLIALGIGVAFGGMYRIDPDIAFPVGLIMVGVGLFDLIVFVPMLVRRWKSPD